ncbi:hypothetical protein CRYUN_Cryun13aG0029800 [Craigia yunnanensis]
MSMMEVLEEDFGEQFPVGYRFVPTDEELVTHYLINKVFCNPLPPSAFQDINASKLHMQFSGGEREWFFFIHEDGNFDDGNFDNKQNKAIRMVGDKLGFWRSDGEETLFGAVGSGENYKRKRLRS